MIEHYICDCSDKVEYVAQGSALECPACSNRVELDNGVYRFNLEESNQNNLFDSIYSAGYNTEAHQRLQSERDEYLQHAPTALHYLEKAGCDLTHGIQDISILDAACGAGWTAAAFYTHPNIKNCHIHAFDISLPGVLRLKEHLSEDKSSNSISYSTQDALDMRFADEQFDLIVGSSILHHFDDFQAYLIACQRILKPGGRAIFGEPFAVGYGLIYTAMKVAANEMGINDETLNRMYADATDRISHRGDTVHLSQLVDKHLFYYDEILSVAKDSGFQSCNITPVNSLEYIESAILDELFNEMAIESKALREKAKRIYQVSFELFSSGDSYVRTLSPFNFIVLSK